MAKKAATKPTKAEQEAAEKAALRQRLVDMAYGANKGCQIECLEVGEPLGLVDSMGVEAWMAFIRCVKNLLIPEDQSVLTELWNLHHFDDIEKLTEWLYSNGVRA